ncbi:MAG: hypothetical protein IJA59_07425 [Clostridia bacterium]|nr:hypothetical protein [Clostridia bacterium]
MHDLMKKQYTRREFVRVCGKGMFSAFFLGAAVRVGLPLSLAEEENVLVNSLVTGEKEMRCVFIKRRNVKKSDAFYLMNTDEQGFELFLIDGGIDSGRCYDELLSLRSEILEKAGLAGEAKNGRYKLEITLLVSHFHADHVKELVSLILPARQYFTIRAAYLPAATCLPMDGTYNNNNIGEFKFRAKMIYALQTYHKQAQIIEVPFGEKMDIETRLGHIRLYGANEDWGTPENLKRVSELYYPTEAQMYDEVSTAVLNSNSMWMRAEYGGNSILFTGDTMKKREDDHDEGLERMIAYYGEEVRSNIVKFPHHGQSRNPACPLVKEYLLSKEGENCCILTGNKGSLEAGTVLSAMNVPWKDIERKNVVYSLRESGMTAIDV